MALTAVYGTLIDVVTPSSEVLVNVRKDVVCNLLNLPEFDEVLTNPKSILQLADITVLDSLVVESRLIAMASSNLIAAVIALEIASLSAYIQAAVGAAVAELAV